MSVNIAPMAWLPTQDANGDPLSGYKLFTYAAGSSTKLATFTDSTGAVQQANPIVFGTDGTPSDSIWLTNGLSYKFVLAPSDDTDPPSSPIKTEDNILGVNDTSAVSAASQWTSSGLTPTYVSATSFTVEGDQTTNFHVGRRVQCTVSGGTAYGTITATAYTSLTTVTVVNDSTALDSGLSAVSYGFLTNTNISIPDYTLYDDSVDTTQIVDDAVTTAKIVDAAVTTDKIVDSGVTTAKIADNAVTLAKMAGLAAGNLISGDGSGDPQAEVYLKWYKHSTVATTSGTSVSFTSIPSNILAMKLVLNGVSVSGTDKIQVKLGDSGGLESTGYEALWGKIGGSGAAAGTTAFVLTGSLTNGDTCKGDAVISLEDSNAWVMTGNIGISSDIYVSAGNKTLSDTLTQISFMPDGANTFDAGSVTLWLYGNGDA